MLGCKKVASQEHRFDAAPKGQNLVKIQLDKPDRLKYFRAIKGILKEEILVKNLAPALGVARKPSHAGGPRATWPGRRRITTAAIKFKKTAPVALSRIVEIRAPSQVRTPLPGSCSVRVGAHSHAANSR